MCSCPIITSSVSLVRVEVLDDINENLPGSLYQMQAMLGVNEQESSWTLPLILGLARLEYTLIVLCMWACCVRCERCVGDSRPISLLSTRWGDILDIHTAQWTTCFYKARMGG